MSFFESLHNMKFFESLIFCKNLKSYLIVYSRSSWEAMSQKTETWFLVNHPFGLNLDDLNLKISQKKNTETTVDARGYSTSHLSPCCIIQGATDFNEAKRHCAWKSFLRLTQLTDMIGIFFVNLYDIFWSGLVFIISIFSKYLTIYYKN